MTLEELAAFIEEADSYLKEKYPQETAETRVFSRTIKISEELGELCGEVMAQNNQQRQEKLDAANRETLGSEFADVLITTLLLAHSMEVDIPAALEKKIAKIRARFAK